jgi:catechol 2,3-dioxygenase-like lactoylglutathione lyase family enzyme
MPFHHIAVATKDMPAIDAFYGEATGFELVKVEIAPTPEGGWAKHFFYDTGNGEMMAFWELHDDTIGKDYKTALSLDMGMPPWVNHIAFFTPDKEDLVVRRDRWLNAGYDVLEIDHGWCTSLYTMDPNGTLTEFCLTTREFTEEDKRIAKAAVFSDNVENSPPPKITNHKAKVAPLHTRLEHTKAS